MTDASKYTHNRKRALMGLGKSKRELQADLNKAVIAFYRGGGRPRPGRTYINRKRLSAKFAQSREDGKAQYRGPVMSLGALEGGRGLKRPQWRIMRNGPTEAPHWVIDRRP